MKEFNNKVFQLGTLTVKAKIPLSIDSLDIGYSDIKKVIIKYTTKGFIYKNKLYKTHDYNQMIKFLESNDWDIVYHNFKLWNNPKELKGLK